MNGDEHPGQSAEVLRVADDSLREGHPKERQSEAHRARRGVGHPECDHQAHGETEEEEHGVRMQPGNGARIHAESRLGVRIA